VAQAPMLPSRQEKNMHIVLGFAAFIVLITLLDTHSEQQRTRRKLGSDDH
jgi:hypothetical protein